MVAAVLPGARVTSGLHDPAANLVEVSITQDHAACDCTRSVQIHTNATAVRLHAIAGAWASTGLVYAGLETTVPELIRIFAHTALEDRCQARHRADIASRPGDFTSFHLIPRLRYQRMR